MLFRRSALTLALPVPVQTEPAALNELRSILNVDDDSWPLVVGFLVTALLPHIPHPVLMLGGEQGTGKTTAARIIVRLIDDSSAPTRHEPRDPEQWAIAAAGSWTVALDNVSHVTPWLSDALCRAVTGDGLVRRKLYTDSDLSVLHFRRCVLMTSIDTGTLRGDLADRLLIIDLERIPDDRRRTDAELDDAYKRARPRLLGALLSALSQTLTVLSSVKLSTMPRMADFSRVLAALDRACPGVTGGQALNLFIDQRHRIADEVVESDVLASGIIGLIETGGVWNGTAAALLEALTSVLPNKQPKGWPTSARGMAGQLRRVIPALRAVGIDVTFGRSGRSGMRTIQIEKVGYQPSAPSADTAGASESSCDADGRMVSLPVKSALLKTGPSVEITPSGSEKAKSNPSDDADGRIHAPYTTADEGVEL